jgi:hypothetical protein
MKGEGKNGEMEFWNYGMMGKKSSPSSCLP